MGEVRISERSVNHGRVLGLIELHQPARINAQTLLMVRTMQAALDGWFSRSDVRAIVLTGFGARGFCAGGDLRALHDAMASPETLHLADDFFEAEYRLCSALRRSHIPVLCYGHGIVMGGGCGLFASSSLRIVAPDLMLAMPECSIGLFPDVGASQWLHALPDALGRWMMLTGARLNASDAVQSGLAHAVLAEEGWQALLLRLVDWPEDADADSLLTGLAVPSSPASEWQRVREQIGELQCSSRVDEACERVRSWRETSAWLHAGQRALEHASPLSLSLSWRLMEMAKGLSEPELLALEVAAARLSVRAEDFYAGIHARLIERHAHPAWRHASLEEAGAWLDTHFVS
ncbi:enoyl-CoA hydratase/isomerase family protein [Chitinibacteraceae bacterium HSL-7]